MITIISLTSLSLMILTLTRPASLCEERDKPLQLSPYLDKNQVEKARLLSKVDKDCLEDFVPESHTGFITVDKVLGNHLFFWFFPHATDENAPFLLWLNGGPTVSSMLGLFWENGPMEVTRKEISKNGCNKKQEESDSGYTKRQYPWTKSFSMLYIDNPVGVGFSFSDSGEKGHRFTEEGYTRDLDSFLKQFFKIFPEYKTREIYLGGQSYAGKYISALAYDIHNQIQDGLVDYHLTGIILGGPYYDPESQNEAFYEYLYAIGMISHKSLMDAQAFCKDFYSTANFKNLSDSYISKVMNNFTTFYKGHIYDNIVTMEKPGYSEIASLLNKPKMKRAAHAGDLYFIGSGLNRHYYKKFYRDRLLVSAKSKLAKLMNNYKMLIFNGDYDALVSSPMIEAALLTTPWKSQRKYNSTIKSVWRRDRKSIGYYSLTDKFCRVLVHGAGHQIPHDKPEISYVMLQQFLKYGCVSSIYSYIDSVSDIDSGMMGSLPVIGFDMVNVSDIHSVNASVTPSLNSSCHLRVLHIMRVIIALLVGVTVKIVL